ncbi:hypothetical protein OESDEN_12369, partial [Oesophagostomum dentatum]
FYWSLISDWRSLDPRNISLSDVDIEKLKNLPEKMGIFSFACRMPGDTNGTSTLDMKYCEEWWNNLKTWEKIVCAAMVLAALTELFAILWDIFTVCACCCKDFLLHPLTIAAIFAAACLAVAVAVYGINNKDAFEGVEKWEDIQDKFNNEVGYSFWLACGALVLALLDTLIGALTVCMGKSCC